MPFEKAVDPLRWESRTLGPCGHTFKGSNLATLGPVYLLPICCRDVTDDLVPSLSIIDHAAPTTEASS